MYEIRWLPNATLTFNETLLFWADHNKSFEYPNKIIDAVEKITSQLKYNPFLTSRYLKEEDVYRKIFLKGRFSIYFEIEGKTVSIVHFQSNSQKPFLEDFNT